MRDWLERQQSWIYLIGILTGLTIGLSQPDATTRLEVFLWPLLGGLLYATFTQVPLTRIGQGLKDWRFLAALLLGNFVVNPRRLGWADDPPARVTRHASRRTAGASCSLHRLVHQLHPSRQR